MHNTNQAKTQHMTYSYIHTLSHHKHTTVDYTSNDKAKHIESLTRSNRNNCFKQFSQNSATCGSRSELQQKSERPKVVIMYSKLNQYRRSWGYRGCSRIL